VENVEALPRRCGGNYETARFNALRRGVLSQYTVLPWEDEDEYRALTEALAAEHSPQGPTASHRPSEVQASRLLRVAKVGMAIKAAMQARSRRIGITAGRVVLELEKLAFSNISDFIEVHADGSVDIDLLRATRDRAAAIHDVVVRRSGEGSCDEVRSVKLTRIKLCDKVKALDMLARPPGHVSDVRKQKSLPKVVRSTG
jgi:hypothetical protein